MGKVQRTEAVWKNLFSRNGFGRSGGVVGGSRWREANDIYIYIKFVENFLVRKLELGHDLIEFFF